MAGTQPIKYRVSHVRLWQKLYFVSTALHIAALQWVPFTWWPGLQPLTRTNTIPFCYGCLKTDKHNWKKKVSLSVFWPVNLERLQHQRTNKHTNIFYIYKNDKQLESMIVYTQTCSCWHWRQQPGVPWHGSIWQRPRKQWPNPCWEPNVPIHTSTSQHAPCYMQQW